MGIFRIFRQECVRCGKRMSERTKKGLPTCTDCQSKLEAQKKQIRTCLIDNTEMQKEVIENVVIDRCNSCGGVWLDAGELDIIKRAIEEGRYSKYILGLAAGMAVRT